MGKITGGHLQKIIKEKSDNEKLKNIKLNKKLTSQATSSHIVDCSTYVPCA